MSHGCPQGPFPSWAPWGCGGLPSLGSGRDGGGGGWGPPAWHPAGWLGGWQGGLAPLGEGGHPPSCWPGERGGFHGSPCQGGTSVPRRSQIHAHQCHWGNLLHPAAGSGAPRPQPRAGHLQPLRTTQLQQQGRYAPGTTGRKPAGPRCGESASQDVTSTSPSPGVHLPAALDGQGERGGLAVWGCPPAMAGWGGAAQRMGG